MTLTPRELDQLATLAHLALTPEERERLGSDLNAIVGFVERIARQENDAAPIDTGRAPLVLADDAVEPSLPTRDALASAPARSDSAVVAKPLEPSGA